MKVEKTVPIEWVRVGERARQDLGDIDSLAKSIKAQGLIQAIAVKPDGSLLAGRRRLEAHRRLGLATIAARIVESFEDAALQLRIERDENTERKAMTPEELVRLGRALEELERPKAMARQAATQLGGSNGKTAGDPGGDQLNTTEGAKTREVVGEALGISGTTYARAKAVVDAAEDDTLLPEERATAREALDEMNATGRVNGSYEKIRKARDARLGAPRQQVIADAKKQRRAIAAAAANLGGIVFALKQVGDIHPDITSEEAAQWVDDLSEARRALEVLIKRLKEHTSA